MERIYRGDSRLGMLLKATNHLDEILIKKTSTSSTLNILIHNVERQRATYIYQKKKNRDFLYFRFLTFLTNFMDLAELFRYSNMKIWSAGKLKTFPVAFQRDYNDNKSIYLVFFFDVF